MFTIKYLDFICLMIREITWTWKLEIDHNFSKAGWAEIMIVKNSELFVIIYCCAKMYFEACNQHQLLFNNTSEVNVTDIIDRILAKINTYRFSVKNFVYWKKKSMENTCIRSSALDYLKSVSDLYILSWHGS